MQSYVLGSFAQHVGVSASLRKWYGPMQGCFFVHLELYCQQATRALQTAAGVAWPLLESSKAAVYTCPSRPADQCNTTAEAPPMAAADTACMLAWDFWAAVRHLM